MGDHITATVTKVLPFGVLIQTENAVPGLVTGLNSSVGQQLSVRVDDVDTAKNRFSASPA